uniref:Uncharacterized protein n=1 Tax=Glossina palpalis gambiensis TaxID=67801 RepID=A0A1B0BE27_9MUSC
MEEFCSALHPSLQLGTSCVEWFHQATVHCTKLMTLKQSRSYLLKMLKDFIFPKKNMTVTSSDVQIPVDPQRLELQNCYSLFIEFVNDYVPRIQQFVAESATYFFLLEIVFSLLVVMVLGIMLLIAIYYHCKYSRPVEKADHTYDIFEPEKCLQVTADRSLRMAREELRRFDIKQLQQNGGVLNCGKIPILVLKAGSEPRLYNDFATSKFQTCFRLWQLQNQLLKSETGSTTEAENEILPFLSECTRGPRLLVLFADSAMYENITCKNKSVMRIQPSSSSTGSAGSRKSSTSLIPLRRKVTSAHLNGTKSTSKKRNVRFSLSVPPSPSNDSHVPLLKTSDTSRSFLPVGIAPERKMNVNNLYTSLQSRRKFCSTTEVKRKKTIFSLP